MKKDIREIMYELYKESLQEEEHFEELKEEGEEATIGSVYLGRLNGKRVMFITVDKIGNYFEAFKISHFFELGTISDIVYKSEIGTFIIQTDLNFYIKSNEIKKFKKIYQFDKEFVEKILNYREMDIKEKLKSNIERGLHYPFRNKWVDKFKEKEFEIIKPYHIRIFNIIDELEKEEE